MTNSQAHDWRASLRFNPVNSLLASKNEALRFFTRRDLLDEASESVESLWRLPTVEKFVDRQLDSGAWKYPGGKERIRSAEDYNQIETFRALRELVEKYGLNREHPAIQRAAEYLFTHQSEEGDFRGIAGNQYLPYYSAAFMELLIKAGFASDPRIEQGFRWLLSIRQHDGGWAIPIRTVGKKFDAETFRGKTIPPNRSKPFSHLVTGVVLRAFAAHPIYRNSEDGRRAGKLLASRFFKADSYPDRNTPAYWTNFSFPFWFTDLISSLDALSLLGIGRRNPQIQRGLNWFITRQEKHGLWRLTLRVMAREPEPDSWITLAICRVFRRFYA